MKKPGGVTTKVSFNKEYKSNVYKNLFSSDMLFNFTLILPKNYSNTSLDGNMTSSDNVTSPDNMTSSLDITMKGSTGVVIATITTHDYRSKKWGGSTSYVYIPEDENMWSHHVNVTLGECDVMRVEVCLRGLFSSKQRCQVKEINCRGENPTSPLEDTIKKSSAPQKTPTYIFVILVLLLTNQAFWGLGCY
ncbi:uncharacterized protein LOC134812640 [Bolinopsis microptera]|uniref:uncharacterized protein LOC134812640 n=1 Tax=Bolinopsis microptera TaxID=2820187 RepID=UPI003078C178